MKLPPNPDEQGLDRPAPPRHDPTLPMFPGPSPRPERIGPYRILRVLGEGGMGAVFLAEQTEPVVREVALKLMHAGMSAPEDVERFAKERQALAKLTHPHIARMFEAGAAEGGWPYFVMEYVPGKPLIEYCDASRLTIPRRLELFVTICQAVQHAHEKGILHRDLKPSNVLVEEVDERPFPKVIDFGIAQALEPASAEVRQTSVQAIGTPDYMSPEAHQIAPGAAPLDLRADVYSLGVVLYELLLGVTPFDTHRLSALQTAALVTSTEPPSPSARYAGLSADVRAMVASYRGLDPDTLARTLAAGLDAIALTAVARDREQRYAAAGELAKDVGRQLAGQPAIAVAPARRKHKILLVDDDRDVLALLKKRLEDLGFEVAVTAHPRMAVRIALEDPPDLVICDIDMDERPGGDVARDLASDPVTKSIPFLFLSSLVDPASQESRIGGWPMISKSMPVGQLLDWVRKTLG